jgi:hypothetical protein
MGSRFPNPRPFKVNRSYSVAEAARAAGVHENTIRNWVSMGLRPLDNSRPAIFAGDEFHRFLNEQRKARRQPCQTDELYCLRCRKPQRPAGGMADFVHTADGRGRLSALCPACDGFIVKLMSSAALPVLAKTLSIQEQQRELHITDRS